MKILSCYIAGFGKFVNKSFDFSSDLIVLKEENGWGKTTLADFICCMLYGQDAGRSKAIENNDRAKYMPWSGGAYGGSLTFLYKNQRYRVERSFGKTPAYDVTRIYDQNNMPTFEFGDKGERLGEILFGVDSDGYRRSVYVPQGDIRTDGLPDDMKNRLLSLLNTGGTGGNGAAAALEKLDAADKALRAKRKPGKGKLDEIDERLDDISNRKAEWEYSFLQAQQLRKNIAEADEKIRECNARIQVLAQAIERESRRSELAVKKQAYDEAQAACRAAEKELAELNTFFLQVPPASVNLDGIRGAVTDFYTVKARLTDAEGKLSALEADYKRFLTLKTQKEACEKILDSYDEILEKRNKRKKFGGRKKGKLIIPPKRKSNVLIMAAALLLAVVGGVLVDIQLILGLSLLGAGLLGMFFVFFRVLPRREKVQKSSTDEPTVDPALSRRYDEAYDELDGIEAELAALPENTETEYLRLSSERDGARNMLTAREQGIQNFFRNFGFGEIYDYRGAVATLEERIAAHAKASQTLAAQQVRAQDFAEENKLLQSGESVTDMRSLQAQKTAAETEKENLSQNRAKAAAEVAALENAADKTALDAEEGLLLEEKRRLEKRHRAILAAKQILCRAKENIAGKYLDPVERGCRYYLEILSSAEHRENKGAQGTPSAQNPSSKLRFAADGTPLYEETGVLREMGYYSVGTKELVGFCTRLALADAVFTKEKPVLVLDDPFVNLDDSKTEAAKKLVRYLSKRYQILYLTCKEERRL